MYNGMKHAPSQSLVIVSTCQFVIVMRNVTVMSQRELCYNKELFTQQISDGLINDTTYIRMVTVTHRPTRRAMRLCPYHRIGVDTKCFERFWYFEVC